MKNKKILFIITKTIIGGAQKFISDQIKMLHQENYDLYLATSNDGFVFQNNKEYLTGYFLDNKIEKKTSILYLIKLKKFIIENEIDLIVCNSANGGLYGRLVAFLAKKKSIYVSHGWSSIYNGGKFSFILNKLEFLLSIIGNRVLCISQNDALLAKNVINVPKNKIVTIPNCIFPLKNSNIRKQKDHYKVLFLGRLSHPKRPDLIMKAVKNIENVTLYIVGTGENDFFYKNIINENQLKNVVLLGEISNFDDFENYDIFSLISLSEGLPMSVLEAMSSGMPMVLSNINGCIPLINNNGILTENNIDSIKESLIKTIEKIEEFSINSKRNFDENYNILLNKNKYINLYNSLL